MTEDGPKSVIVKVGLTALVLACVGDVRDKPSDNRNTTVQVVEAADESADKESESCNDAIGTYCGFVDGNAAKLNLMENQKFQCLSATTTARRIPPQESILLRTRR